MWYVNGFDGQWSVLKNIEVRYENVWLYWPLVKLHFGLVFCVYTRLWTTTAMLKIQGKKLCGATKEEVKIDFSFDW